MTKTLQETLREILVKNPNAIAKFSNYYKYSFAFTCEGVYFEVGGDSSDIYRFCVEPEMPLSQLIGQIDE